MTETFEDIRAAVRSLCAGATLFDAGEVCATARIPPCPAAHRLALPRPC